MADHSISRTSEFNGAKLANARSEFTWAENYSVITDAPTHCNHTFRLVACCSFAGVKRTTRPEHNQSHSRSLGRIELAFNHRWASEQFPSTKFPTWLWSTRGTGFQALSQECRELESNPGQLVYESDSITARPLAHGRVV